MIFAPQKDDGRLQARRLGQRGTVQASRADASCRLAAACCKVGLGFNGATV